MRRPSTAARLAAVAAATALVLAACGGDDDGGDGGGGDGGDGGSSTTAGGSTNKQLYFVDGNTADYSKDFKPGTLTGVRASYPGAELGDEFRKRLLTVDKNLDSFTYGPESYDATIVPALAAIAAKNDNAKAIAQQMVAVSGPPGTKCDSFQKCSDLLSNGEEIDYEGVSSPINFGNTGSPTAATIGIYQYKDDNTFENSDYITGEITENPKPTAGQQIEKPISQGDGVLKFGTLLPQTGDLAFLEPPETAGVKLAVQDINKAGGVLGKDVQMTSADSGDGTPNIAPQEANKLLGANVDVVVGAASSDVSLAVLDQITNAGVMQISPANTSTKFDTYDDKGLYFRTAPSDVLQGRVLADTIAADGYTNVAIMARQEAYGEALAENVEKYFTESGGEVVAKVLYSPESPNFSAEIGEIAAADPDAIVLIAFDETKKIIPGMIEAGIGPNE